MGDRDPGAQPSDEDLVRRIRAGDEAAARTLFERHLPALRVKVEARLPAALRGKVGASDVVQDAWLAAYLALGDFEDRGEGSFAAWLRTIVERRVANEVRDHLDAACRDVRREMRLATDAGSHGPVAQQTSPSGQVAAAESSAELRAVLEDLPEDRRAVVRLVHEEGLTFVEAGARMGRSPDAVRMLYSRALAELAERLGDDEASGV